MTSNAEPGRLAIDPTDPIDPTDKSALEAIHDALECLQPSALELRRDPRGSWLPSDLRARLDATPGADAVLRSWIETELLLLDGATASPDPYFTARVVRALPSLASDGLGARRRRSILAVTYAVAAVAGLVVVWPWLGSLSSASELAAIDPTHGWLEALRSGGAGAMATLGAVALAISLPFSGRRRVRSGA